MNFSRLISEQTEKEDLKKTALLNWLSDNGDIEIKTEEDIENQEKLEQEIEKYNDLLSDTSDEELIDDYESKIEDFQEKLEEIKNKVNIDNVEEIDDHYNLSVFYLPDTELEDRRYAVGTYRETEIAAYDALKNLIRVEGVGFFNKSFLEGHLDEERIEQTVRDFYYDSVFGNPEDYLEDSHRQLSFKQEEKIEIFENRIEKIYELIENFNQILPDGEYKSDKIEELNNQISDYEDEIESIKEEPDGEYPEDLLIEKIDQLVDDEMDNPLQFLNNFGLEIDDYIDQQSLIEDAIQTDGLGHNLNSYDGSADEVYVGDELFIVMRID